MFGAGQFFGIDLPFFSTYNFPILQKTFGGFLVFGIMIAIVGLISKGKAPYKKNFGCEGCPNASICNVAAGQTACGGKEEAKEGGEAQ